MLSNYCIFDIIDNYITVRPYSADGCELLSNYCIFDIIDNSNIVKASEYTL